MQVRKVVTRSGRGFRGFFPSKKLNRHVAFESLLERDAIALFEKSDQVVSYREQPVLIYFYDGLEQKKYYPDFELEMDNGEVIHVEVKPAILLLSLKLTIKYQAIQSHYCNRPEHFAILTDKELRRVQSDKTTIYDLLNNNHLAQQKGDGHDAFLI